MFIRVGSEQEKFWFGIRFSNDLECFWFVRVGLLTCFNFIPWLLYGC
jgi:hypothetical protein